MSRNVALLVAAVGLVTACGSSRQPRSDASPRSASADGGSAEAAAIPTVAECLPARTSEPLPPRPNVVSTEAAPPGSGRTVFLRDLFGLFKNHCGQCHVDSKQGNFQITESTFAASFDQKILDVMKSDDPAKFMPPEVLGGKPYSQRSNGDPIRELVGLLELWVANGKSSNPFTVDTGSKEVEASARYLMAPELGAALTNLGNCIPTKPLVGTATAKMDELDAFFLAAKDLPERLDQTDFVALDSETLARHGVISFAPAYPLWSDSAGKMRHIRVPRGQSVVFDKGSQSFAIPDNTRFYKTFLKKVIDRDGNETWKKIETRLIVVRHDTKGPGDTSEIAALFGSYVWNEEETAATLLREPLRDGQPFTDLLITYVANEPKAEAIKASKPASLNYELEERNPGVLRRYAIPGSTRCRECHMGSVDGSFSLGFTPLQISRRASDTGGTYEPTGEDELTQLERLIDYGVITGVTTPADVLPLEKSQGARSPRNEYELKAQGYMLGNCAGCHNPRGFPSVKNRELKDVLDFLPSTTTGGVFQFSLEKTSPRIKRGQNLDEPIPYITPSLRDLPRDAETTDYNVWKPKWFQCQPMQAECRSTGAVEFIDAPWRSLIYRNVDAPFSYSDDYAIFPHMPRNTPGFDCRAPRIMADWMVSIPARRKNNDTTSEDSFPSGLGLSPSRLPSDMEPQPYREILPGDPLYDSAVTEAKSRHAIYRAGRRHQFCPDTTDIVDPRVRDKVLVPPDKPIAGGGSDGLKLTQYSDNVPDRAHWVPTDLTEPPVDWLPRRFDWDKVLVPDKVTDKSLTPEQKANKNNEFHSYREVLEALDDVRISKEFRDFALTEVPFGLWKDKPECASKLGATKKAGELAGGARPAWLERAKAAPDARVYTSSPGAAVFNLICISCHGPKADSRGIQAETLADLTGGDARVANLRDGLLGRGPSGTRNIDRVFGPMAGLYPKGAPDAKLVTAEDWAARYVAWMGLGGTLKQIPQAILNNVGATRVLGEIRRNFSASSSANMLQAAQVLCRSAIPHSGLSSDNINLESFFQGDFQWGIETALVDKNGDAELWRRLCSFNNRPLVRVARRELDWKEGLPKKVVLKAEESYFWADGYPADAPVMNQNGKIEMGIKPENTFAVCAERPSDPDQAAQLTAWLAEHPVGGAGGQVMPVCPESLFENGDDGSPKWALRTEGDATKMFLGANAWAARGAINAGLAVMLYLDQLQRGVQPTPRFDQCQELP